MHVIGYCFFAVFRLCSSFLAIVIASCLFILSQSRMLQQAELYTGVVLVSGLVLLKSVIPSNTSVYIHFLNSLLCSAAHQQFEGVNEYGYLTSEIRHCSSSDRSIHGLCVH